MDKTLKLAKGGTITKEHVKKACTDVNYYSENLTDKRLESILEKGKDYFGLGRVVSIILCLFLGPIMGIIARF